MFRASVIPVSTELIKEASCYEEIINEIIWNNQFLCYDKKSMYRRDIVNLGFVKIKDLISASNSFSYDFSSLDRKSVV